MRLHIDPATLAPDNLSEGMERHLRDAALRSAVEAAEPARAPSASMEGEILERWVRRVDWSSVDVVVALGLGSGLVIDLIRGRSQAPILILEPRASVVRSVLSQRPASQDNVYIYGDVIPLRTGLRTTSRFGVRVMLFAPPWARQELADYVPGVEESISQAHIQAVVNDNTIRIFGHTWLDVMLKSLPHIAGRVPTNRLHGALQGVPGVVVAAGPSLDRNVEILKRLEGKAAICAVNTSLKALDKAGIRPNLLAMVEHQDVVSQVVDSPAIEGLAILPGPYAHPTVYDLDAQGFYPSLYRTSAFGDWLSQTLDIQGLSVGGSVACMAFSVLSALGCDPIILVGQDCAMTDRRMYAAGTSFETVEVKEEGGIVELVPNALMLEIGRKAAEEAGRKQTRKPQVKLEVEAWGGEGKVMTIPSLDVFRRWYEERGYDLTEKHRLVNATEGGARISGFEEMRLADLCDELDLEEIDVLARLATAAEASEPVDADTLARALRSESRAASTAGKIAKRASRTAQKLLGLLARGRWETTEARQELGRLKKLEKSLRRLSPEALLLDAHVGPALDKTRRRALQDEAKDLKEATQHSLESSIEIFKEVSAVAVVLGPKLGRVAEALDAQGRT